MNMKLLNKIFKTKMFFVVLILFILHNFILDPTGFNRTINWGLFDKINYYIKIYFPFILIFYFIGYGILYILKKETNKYLSIAHTFFIIITLLIIKSQTKDIITYFSLIGFIIYIINIARSKKQKKC